jgi:V/A-type H+/Na+-transporting ATPase subunit I
MIRPRPARWFELLVARDDTTLALEALAATGAVELETRAGAALPASFADLRPLLLQFGELALRYRAFWPTDGLRASPFPEPPRAALERCIADIRAWAQAAEPLIRRLQRSEAEREALRRWRGVVAALAGGTLDLVALAASGPLLQCRLFVLPPGVAPEGLVTGEAGATGAAGAAAEAPLLRHLDADGQPCALAVGTPGQLQALAQQVLAAKGQVLELPRWLQRERAHNDAELASRLAALDAEDAAARDELAALAGRHRLREALADAHRLQWVVDNVQALEAGELLCWITGWTSAPQAALLEQAVERSGARALLRLPPPPPGARAPLLLANPWWARPFEVFARALGMPSGTEADPSALLALAVPLMFGYMFGDVGQGLVIAAAGFALRGRFPMARLFIAGGLSAAFFGLLFGSVFSLHLMHPWWVAPLDDPLAVLLVPLIGGAALLTLGLLLSALEAHWRGELARWLATDAGLLLAYLGIVASFAWPPGLLVAGAGALLFCAGHAWHEQRALAGAVALAELVERLLQLLINTLSFARVGAFALAHAGLSSAVVALMGAAGHVVAGLVVLVIGNLVIIVLEGLVVSIQTTRLVLFEFFTRFLEATGRVFRPLPPPPSTLQES